MVLKYLEDERDKLIGLILRLENVEEHVCRLADQFIVRRHVLKQLSTKLAKLVLTQTAEFEGLRD